MKHTTAIETLKTALKTKGVRYKEIAEKLHLSEASVKRIFSEGTLSLERFFQVCESFNISLSDIVDLAEISSRENRHIYSNEQEEFFTKNPRCLAYFDQLLLLKDPKKIMQKFNLSQRDSQKFLAALEKLKLIEWLPKDKIRLLVSENIVWQEHGPLRKSFLELIKKEFLQSPFNQQGEVFKMVLLDMSPESQKKACLMLRETLTQISQMSRFDKDFARQNHKVGVMIALRPWNFSELEKI